MNVVVLGSGGREHAIASKLNESSKIDKIFAIPGNAGTPNNVDISLSDFASIKDFCLDNKVEVIVVGPEKPLADGIVDYFKSTNIKVFGPDKQAAQLESSKLFAKEFMLRHQVPTAGFKKAESVSIAREYITQNQLPCVIKYDGLAAGKGVYVCDTPQKALAALEEYAIKFDDSSPLLIEELLVGQELSIMAFTNGSDYRILQPSQDHKQLLEGDKGPNTGGMGAFCPVDFCDDSLLKQIEETVIKPAIQGLKAEGFNYHGVLYFGLMLTAEGAKVLEFNVRLGDPETEVVLPALDSDFAELLLSCFDDSLSDLKVKFKPGYFVDVVLVSGGYPGAYKKGCEIVGLDYDFEYLFHAGTKIEGNKVLTSGGRVLNVVSQAPTLTEAIRKVYQQIEYITFDDMNYRRDIGKRKCE